VLTRTSRGLRTVRTGYAHRPPACCTHLGLRAAARAGHHCTVARRTYRTAYRGTPGHESATAIVNRTCERLWDGAARTTKWVVIAPCRSAGGWLHVAVNIAAS